MEKQEFEKNCKYYIVAAKCGHCGNGYFVPILLPVSAKSMKEAIEKADNTPRVKHEKKGAVICAEKCSQSIYWMVRFINNTDIFMIEAKSDYSDNERRIVLPQIIEEMQNAKYNNTGYKKYIDKVGNIKTADRYPEHLVLQRYFAPKYVNGKLEFPKRYNFDEILPQYFTEKTRQTISEIHKGEALKKVAFQSKANNERMSDKDFADFNWYKRQKNNYISIAMLYCKLFSNTNPLGIKYFDDVHEIAYFDKLENKLKYVEIPKDKQIEEFINIICDDKPIYAKNDKGIEFDDLPAIKTGPSQLEKFKSRYAKYLQISQPTEMGE